MSNVKVWTGRPMLGLLIGLGLFVTAALAIAVLPGRFAIVLVSPVANLLGPKAQGIIIWVTYALYCLIIGSALSWGLRLKGLSKVIYFASSVAVLISIHWYSYQNFNLFSWAVK